MLVPKCLTQGSVGVGKTLWLPSHYNKMPSLIAHAGLRKQQSLCFSASRSSVGFLRVPRSSPRKNVQVDDRCLRVEASTSNGVSSAYDYDVVIIGAGVGGHGAALHAVEQVHLSCSFVWISLPRMASLCVRPFCLLKSSTGLNSVSYLIEKVFCNQIHARIGWEWGDMKRMDGFSLACQTRFPMSHCCVSELRRFDFWGAWKNPNMQVAGIDSDGQNDNGKKVETLFDTWMETFQYMWELAG